jgi:hypothetical protein
MRRLDAQHYREEANRCREAAEYAQDEGTKALLLVAEGRWITLANQAELVACLMSPQTIPSEGDGTLEKPCAARFGGRPFIPNVPKR